MKTLVIGLDAATWHIITPLLQRGEMPNIASLVESGASGTLRSTIPAMTPSAWTSIATGINPGKHGIYDFVAQNRNTYEIKPINLSSLDQPAVWDIFNTYGSKVGFINFPLAFPPPKIKGFFVSGIGTSEHEEYAFPKTLWDSLKSRGYQIHPGFSSRQGVKKYIEELKKITETQCEVCVEQMGKIDCELYWIVFQGLDWIQHHFWDTKYRGENAVNLFYRYMDEIVGRLLRQTDKSWNVIVLSDHGFRKIKANCYMNNLLEQWGYLKRIQRPAKNTKLGAGVLKAMWKFGRKMPMVIKRAIPDKWSSVIRDRQNRYLQLEKVIDWDQTQAFSYGYMGRIYIHQKNKYSRGIVESATQYSKLCEEIISRLRSLRDPSTGGLIVGDIFRKEDIYTGSKLEDAPDILFNTRDSEYMVYGDFSDKWLQKPHGRVADHAPEGIFICKAQKVTPCNKIEANAIDITPTLLYMHNLPVLADMDGRVLEEIFMPSFTANKSIQKTEAISVSQKTCLEPSERRDKEIVKRLKDLGYM